MVKLSINNIKVIKNSINSNENKKCEKNMKWESHVSYFQWFQLFYILRQVATILFFNTYLMYGVFQARILPNSFNFPFTDFTEKWDEFVILVLSRGGSRRWNIFFST